MVEAFCKASVCITIHQYLSRKSETAGGAESWPLSGPLLALSVSAGLLIMTPFGR